MTNLEKYLDKMLEIKMNFALDENTSEPKTCDEISCKKCLFARC